MEQEITYSKLSAELLQVAITEVGSDEEMVDEDSDWEQVESVPSDSDHNSDSDDDDLFEAIYVQDSSRTRDNPDHFMSKNGKIKWLKTPVTYKGSGTTSAGLDCSTCGVTPLASNVTTPHEIFSLFFNDRVLDLIVVHTNSRLKRMAKRYERCRDSKEVTKEELSAFLGLLLYSGIMKSSHSRLKDLWAQDGTGVDLFRLTMSFSRFQFIMSCLRFDDFGSRRANMRNDKLTPVRHLTELIQTNFKEMYTPGRSVSVYEHVIPFRGKCPFKQHSTEKPKKYGIKLHCLVDTQNLYLLSCEISTHKRKHYDEARVDHILRLVGNLSESNRDVVTTVPYTCVPLALALKQRGLFLLGCSSNKDKDFPRVFRSTRKPVRSCLLGFTDELTLVSYVPQKRQVNIYLSNRVQDRVIDVNSTKPELILAVENFQRGLEDLALNLLNFGVGRKTRRWPLLIFFHLLNMATLNAQIILNLNTGSNALTKSEFVKQLALGLIREQMEKRSHSGYLPKELRKRIRLNVDTPEDNGPPIRHAIDGPTKGRCHVCTRMRDKKSSTTCSMCHYFVCKEHSLVTCSSCFRNMHP